MALIKCPKCGKTISDKAAKCPHCGAPVLLQADSINIVKKDNSILTPKTDVPTSKKKGTNPFLIISAVVVLIIIIFCAIQFSSDPSNQNSPNAELVASEYEAKLNEFKNFTTMDLSALMLHGKVKTVTYYKGAGYRTKFDFDESGALINYEQNDDEFGTTKYEIHHEGNRLVLVQAETFGSWAEVYEIEDGKLVKYECGGDGVGSRNLYYYHDSNNWPRTETLYDYSIEEDAWIMTKSNSLTYDDIDEHGNWKNKVDQDGFAEERRTIEYYPN